MLNDLKKRFNEDGFIVVRDVFKPSEIEFYREVVQEAIKERKQLDLRQLEDKSKYEQSFTQCQNLWEDYPEIRKLTFDQRICKIAAELLDVKAIRIWHDQALVKEAGGRETDPHHDQPYWPIKETNTITAWIPLCDVDSTNGQLGFYPGSHKNRNKQFINIFSGNVDEEEFLESSNLSSSEVCYQELKAGDVSFSCEEQCPERARRRNTQASLGGNPIESSLSHARTTTTCGSQCGRWRHCRNASPIRQRSGR